MKFILSCVVYLLLLVILSASAQGEIILEESFNYDVGPLEGQDGGIGFGEPWSADPQFIEVIEPDTPLSYSVPGGGTIAGGSRAMRLANETQNELANDTNIARRALEGPESGDDLFFSFLYRYEAGIVDNNDFVIWWFNNTDGPNIGLKGNLGDGSGTDDLMARMSCCNPPQQQYAPGWDISEEAETIGEDFLIVGRLFKADNSDSPDDYDQYDLWINPAQGDENNPQASGVGVATDSFANEITTLGMRAFSQEPGDAMIWDELRIGTAWEDVLSPIGEPPPPFEISGSGETYFQDFDSLGTDARNMPKGWIGEDINGQSRRIDSLGLVDGPLAGAVETAEGIVNVGGNAERFSSPTDGRLGTWKDDLDGNSVFNDGDVMADGATDRALGNSRVNADDPGSLQFEITIGSKPLRALVLDWDLEVWGGDPEAAFRGAEGAGYSTNLNVNGTGYFSRTVTLKPGELFDSSFDLSPDATHDPTLINGNEHSVRGNSSDIVEIDAVDGAVSNLIQVSFNANHGGADEGWISAIDNVRLRALAAGDAQADGDVDPADLIQLLAGGAFGQGNIDATWVQGDFDNDGDFDGTDILAVVQALAGEFPKTYAHDPNNGVPDVLINPATGNITLDTNGITIGSIVIDSAAGIFNGPNSPDWDAPGDFAADIDTQISMPISFTNPGYSGVDDLGDGIIGDLAPGFDILGDLTIKYLDPNGELLDGEAHVVPEPSSILMLLIAVSFLLLFRPRFNP